MNMKAAIVGLLLAQGAHAASEEWSLISVDRSVSKWHVREGKGTLEQRVNSYSGRVSVGRSHELEVKLSVSGSEVSGTVETIPGDSGPGEYKGTFQRVAVPGGGWCWETIQLMDGHNYVALKRNVSCP
jgi:hypothetical protein